MDTSRAIDVHSHLFPDSIFARLPAGLHAEHFADADQVGIQVDGGPSGERGASPDVRYLDRHAELRAANGVDLAIVSAWTKLTAAVDDADLEAQLSRVVNEELAAHTAARADYAHLADLPLSDGGRAAEELAQALDEGAVGGMLTANASKGGFGVHHLEPLWKAAGAAGAPLVVHPGYFIPPPHLRGNFLGNIVGYPFETTVAAATMIATGIVDRHPDLQIVLVHGGGYLPYQFGRIAAGLTRRGIRSDDVLPRDYLAWFHFESILFEPEPLRYLLELVGPKRILAGSDCPFSMQDFSLFNDPSRLGLNEQESELVLGGNARALFRLPTTSTDEGYTRDGIA